MKAKNLIKLFALLSFLFGLGVLIMVFINVVTTGGENPTVYTGSDLIFGAKKTTTLTVFGVPYDVSLSIDFSFVLLLAFFLPMILSIILFVTEFTNNNKNVKLIVGIVAFAGFVVSLIFIILLKDFSTATISSENSTIQSVIKTFYGQSPYTYKFVEGYQFAIGAILGMIFAGCGIVSTAIYSVLNVIKIGK